ncbi:universal stress protein [uncultured Dialister sp.]|jgi:nucleotide-binding universal stress UspA family protein|uniref:universal stress protein n=1 Tax=uncultured Dialister sp. TaxID=278064 RepID=UPI0025F2F8C0|nr:universal stress protein [uncultured Dialister sp.]
MEIKKILVPIDGSDASERALGYACSLAEKGGAVVTMLYVVEADVLLFPVYRVNLSESDVDSVKKKGEEILALFGRDVPEGTKVERKVEVGMPGASIVREAEAGKADLIVMGNSGKGSVSSFVMGSVSHYVVHHSSCPVLIVK